MTVEVDDTQRVNPKTNLPVGFVECYLDQVSSQLGQGREDLVEAME
jgi:hypothetical protein